MSTAALQNLLLHLLLCSCSAWNVWWGQGLATAVLSASILFDDKNTIDSSLSSPDLLKSLKAPTDDTPQIVLPPGMVVQNENAPLVQGLVYLTRPQERPVSTGVLLLTVRDVKEPDQILAGAKIPVAKIRFPFNFAMSEKNLIASQSLNELDLIVDARLCPTSTPCVDDEASLKAKGIAKLITNLPGSNGISIRAAASLGLK